MMQRLFFLPVFLLASFGAVSAEAGFTFTFAADEFGAPIPTGGFHINGIGGTVKVSLFLTETYEDAPSFFYLDDGLISANFHVKSSDPSVADVLDLVHVALNPGFNDLLLSIVTVAPGSVEADVAVDQFIPSPPVLPYAPLSTEFLRSTYFATLTYTAQATGSTGIEASLPSDGNIFTAFFDEIAPVDSASTTITVPEPGSLLMCLGLIGTVGAGAWLRRRRAAR
jgi:hypothetical protein